MFINFDGYDLTEYIKVMNVKRPVLSDRTNYTVDIPSMHGSYYTGFKYAPKTIEVEFALICKNDVEYFNFKRTLAAILDTNVPSKLIIGDEPNKYYYAVVDGAVDIDKILSNGIGSISFICHNPVAYSTEPKVIHGTDGGVVTVNNEGSADTHPIVNVEFSKNANFLQLTNYTGETILIGSRPNVDKPTVQTNSTILKDACESTADWVGTGNVLDANREVTGGLVVNTGGYGLCCANYGTGTKWHGGAMRRNLNTTLDEFEVRVCMEHNSKGTLKGGGSNATTPPSNGATYKCTAKPSLRIRSGRGTNYKILGSIPKGKTVTVTDISKGWGKVTYNKITGYSYMEHLTKVNNKAKAEEEPPSAESRLGKIEVYGFDNNGQKLFKFELSDSEEFFEYTKPSIQIGSTVVLEDKKAAPKPKTVTTKDNDGNKTISKTDSGKYGDFNEFSGNFKIKRTKKGKGNKYNWNCEVNKCKDGQVIKQLVSNTLSNSAYPTGGLNHIVVWFGAYGENEPVDTMNVTDIKVTRLGKAPTVPSNEVIFAKGDEIIIDCEEGAIYKDGDLYMEQLDIGSSFFKVGKGISQFMVLSDDKGIDVITGITEKWL